MEYQLVIKGTIGDWWEGVTSDYVRYIVNQNKGKELHVGFCSLGGSVKDALEIQQAFRDHGDVRAHAFAMNASASTIAMLGCKSIDIVKNSFFMIHNTSVVVDEWNSFNKEQIDELIKGLNKTRDELATFDDVLATMYADKCKKKVAEVKEQMNKNTWMSAEEALEWGLVDEIREDKETEGIANEVVNLFNREYGKKYKDAGIPPLISVAASAGIEAVIDRDGNPTESFLQKTWQGISKFWNRNNNQQAKQENNEMIKIFMAVGMLLGLEGFKAADDGSIVLSQEQMKTIDDELASLGKQLNDAVAKYDETNTALTGANDELAQLRDQVKSLEEQVKNLNASPAGDAAAAPVGEPDDEKKEMSVKDIFNRLG